MGLLVALVSPSLKTSDYLPYWPFGTFIAYVMERNDSNPSNAPNCGIDVTLLHLALILSSMTPS